MAASSKKFNLTELLNQRSKEAAPRGQQDAAEADKGETVASVTADIYDLIPSKENFYSVEDVQDLKQSIELLGILQPLLVTDEEDGKRRIIAGHRRRLAIMQLVDEGKESFRYVPVMVKPTKNAILDRLALIMANRFREKTDWEKMTESIETEKLVQELKGQMDIPGRTRDLLAEIIETSPAQLGRYKAIYNNLAAELMAEFRAGKIGISVIYEISQLEKEWQLRSLELFRENGTLALPDIKEIKRRREEAAQVTGQMEIGDINGQQDTQEASQTDEMAEDGEFTGEAAETAGEGKNSDAEETGKEWGDGYIDPQPESKDSLCYSCGWYETCHDKKGNVTGCNAYKDRREAYKTEEQKYDEMQAEIDAETRKRMRERQQDEITEREPEEKQHGEIRISPDRYEEIVGGKLSFLLLKKDGFRVGEELLLPEYADGQQTGREAVIRISYIWEDWTGLEDNYCIIGFKNGMDSRMAIGEAESINDAIAQADAEIRYAFGSRDRKMLEDVLEDCLHLFDETIKENGKKNGHNTVQWLTTVPSTDMNFVSALKGAEDSEIREAVRKMEGKEGNRSRIAACERELRRRMKKKDE